MPEAHPGMISQPSTLSGAAAALDGLLNQKASGTLGLDRAIAIARERVERLEALEAARKLDRGED